MGGSIVSGEPIYYNSDKGCLDPSLETPMATKIYSTNEDGEMVEGMPNITTLEDLDPSVYVYDVATNSFNSSLGAISLEVDEEVDAQFDENRYRYFIRSRGQTNSEFKLQLTNEMLSGQLFDGYRLSGFITNQMLLSVAELVFQTRSYYYLTVPRQPVLESIEIPETEVKDFYAQNRSSFQSEEQVSVDFIEISAEILARDVKADKNEIAVRFRDEAKIFTPSVSRRAAHILLPDLNRDLILSLIHI